MLLDMQKDLRVEAAQLPYYWEIQERLRSSDYYTTRIQQRVLHVLNHPIECEDVALLKSLASQLLCAAQTIGYISLKITTQLTYKDQLESLVVKGNWAKDAHVSVKGVIRTRVLALVKALGFCQVHIAQLRYPEQYPWKEHKSVDEIDRLYAAAEQLETELRHLYSTPDAKVVYARYLELETILGSFEHFEAYVLGKSHTYWQSEGDHSRITPIQ